MYSPRAIFRTIFKESNNSFEGEAVGEQVILLLRRHPFVILVRLAFSLILVSVPIIIGTVGSVYIATNNLTTLFLFLSSLWFLLLWQIVFYSLTMYTLDVWILTNRRIIDSTQQGFFRRTISELQLTRVQDITTSVKGVIPTLLHFGDLRVQTAATTEKFLFRQIPNPDKVKDEIMKAVALLPHY